MDEKANRATLADITAQLNALESAFQTLKAKEEAEKAVTESKTPAPVAATAEKQ